MLTQKFVKECFRYDPSSGIFTWRVRPRHHFASSVGQNRTNLRYGLTIAGNKNAQGYMEVTLLGRPWGLHRIAYLYMTGIWPKDCVDHINHVRHDNRWENLRSITHQENKRNYSRLRNNTSGCTGVSKNKRDGKWYARIKVSKKQIHLGVFNDYFDAICARKSAENRYGFHKNHGS